MMFDTGKEKKERDRLYGNLLMDFINAKEPDEAFVALFSNIQKVFDLSSDFTGKALERFPPLSAIQTFLPMNKLDKNLFQAFLEKWRLERKPEAHYERNRYLPEWEKEASSLSESFSEERFWEIEQIATHYSKVSGALRAFDEYRKKLRKLIEEVLEEKNIFENKWLRGFFKKSRLTGGPYLAISKNGEIYERPLFSEKSFLVNQQAKDLFPKTYKQALAYSVIRFLKPPNNRALIRKCGRCEKYFIASRNDKRIKKCKACSPMNEKSKEWRKEYMRGWRKKRKQEKEARDIEAKVAHFMGELDITREEALKIIKADSML